MEQSLKDPSDRVHKKNISDLNKSLFFIKLQNIKIGN